MLNRPVIWSLLPLALLVGCDGSPSDLREWQKSDHRGSSGQAQQAPPSRAGASAESAQANQGSVVGVIWQAQCALCHGPSGQGNGPQGPMWNTPDLTAQAWQKETSDEEIASVIVNGRGSMPKFEGLSPEIVSSLVVHIRGFYRHDDDNR